VIADTRDFGIGRRVCADNWRALRSVGENANRRLCDAQAEDARPAPDVVTLAQVTRPSETPDGLHAPALCFGDPRVMAILAALLLFSHVLAGFRNRDLVELVASLLDQPYTARQATYDLRRLRRKGLITRLPRSQRYQLTPLGRRVAVLFTKAHSRVLAPGLALPDPALPPDIADKSALGRAWRRLDHALDDFVARELVAA
jgi:DNA-binding transcriptional ArsR family regulator